ncbi:ankyrin repeat domain-containing protein [Wolbachia endosymbiont (group A) of Rhinocyllus conicus]|uniref:ankyrin repeat domain-containing protein n=1 Tax=Wolbachia endosymbiont (group A) of Rhinocyllus conicus TaxID=2954053 RepID=UPI002226B8DF|nr:ankyrin repeat domain-containing protein [Wolbachia endosymbiont (group A) of Rhinocyllus conicus]
MTKENSTSSELVHNNELLSIITKKVTKGKHKHLHPEVGKDKTLNKCKGLFKEGASPKILTKVLTKLGESPEEQEKYYKYYTQHFLPALKKEIKQSKKLDPTKKEEIEQVISEAINKSSKKDHPDNVDQNETGRRGSMESETESGNSGEAEDNHDASKKHSISSANTISEDQEVENGITGKSEDSGIESGNSSEAEDDHADEKDHISGIPIFHTANEDQEVENGIMNSSVQYTDKEQPIFKVIKNGDQGKFREYLKGCTDISSVKDKKENNILHLIVTQLEKKQKFDFLNTVLDVSKKEGKEQLKAQLEKAVNDKNGNGQTPLQALLLSKVTKEKHSFETTPRKTLTPLKKLIPHYDNTIVSAIQLLKLGANIDDLQLSKEELQELSEKQKIYYLNFLEKLAESVKKSELEPEIKTNTETKIKEIIGYTINTPDSNPLHSAIENNDKKLFEELLQKGADISLKDTNGNNALHHIALLKGEQKVAYLELILNLVEKEVISQDKLREAVDATNQKEDTPLQAVLKTKARKEKIEYLKQGTIFDSTVSCSNTTKFCAMLLEMGADPCSLELEGQTFDTKKYYLTLLNLKEYPRITQEAQKKVRELKEKLEEKYHCKTASKKCQSGIEKAGSFIEKTASTTGKAVSAAGKYIDPAKRTRQTLISITTVIFISAVAYGVSQGYIGALAALFLAAIAIATCLALTLGFSGVKKCFEKLTNKTKSSTDNDRQTKRARNPKSEMKDTSTKSPADGLTI